MRHILRFLHCAISIVQILSFDRLDQQLYCIYEITEQFVSLTLVV